MRRIAIAVALLACACAAEAPPPGPATVLRLESGKVRGVTDEQRTSFLIPIDGEILEQQFDPFTSDEDQFAVQVGFHASGEDQGSLIILSRTGEQVARHDFAPHTPYGFEQINAPREGLTFRLEHRKPLLAVCAYGPHHPSAVVLFEVESRSRLVRRLAYWSYGHLENLAHRGSLVAVSGVNGRDLHEKHTKYGATLIVLDLDHPDFDLYAAEDVERAIPKNGEIVPDPPAIAVLDIPLDDPQKTTTDDIEFSGDGVRVHMHTGLVYELNLKTDEVTLESTEKYAWNFRNRSTYTKEELPDTIEKHLRNLRAATHLHTRK